MLSSYFCSRHTWEIYLFKVQLKDINKNAVPEAIEHFDSERDYKTHFTILKSWVQIRSETVICKLVNKSS